MLFFIWFMMFYSSKFSLDFYFHCHCAKIFHSMINILSFFISLINSINSLQFEKNNSDNPKSHMSLFTFCWYDTNTYHPVAHMRLSRDILES
jgi:hypothetical protein